MGQDCVFIGCGFKLGTLWVRKKGVFTPSSFFGTKGKNTHLFLALKKPEQISLFSHVFQRRIGPAYIASPGKSILFNDSQGHPGLFFGSAKVKE